MPDNRRFQIACDNSTNPSMFKKSRDIQDIDERFIPTSEDIEDLTRTVEHNLSLTNGNNNISSYGSCRKH